MPTIDDIAICIRHWDYSETSQTVSLFGRSHGVIRGLAKGSKRAKANFSGGIDLFARGELRAIVKAGTDLANIIEWTLVDAHWFLRENLAAHRRALYFADLIHHMVRDHDPHAALFDSLAHALTTLQDDDSLEAGTAQFLWSLLAETGYRPQVLRDAATGQDLSDNGPLAFSPQAGGVVANSAGLDNWRLRPETLRILQDLARSSDGAAVEGKGAEVSNSTEGLQSNASRRAAALLSAYIRTILGYEPATLRWVFPELVESGAR